MEISDIKTGQRVYVNTAGMLDGAGLYIEAIVRIVDTGRCEVVLAPEALIVTGIGKEPWARGAFKWAIADPEGLHDLLVVGAEHVFMEDTKNSV